MNTDLQRKRILILCQSDLKRDPRPYRQIYFLSDFFEVHAAGFVDPEIDGVPFFKIGKSYLVYKDKWKKFFTLIRLKFSQYEKFYWRQDLVDFIHLIHEQSYDLILANDLDCLPLALKIAQKKNAKVLFDAHEYSPRQFEDQFRWRFIYQKYSQYLCKKYIPEVDAMVTVCDGIAEEYHRHYGILPEVVWSAPFYSEIEPQFSSGGSIRLVHHGIANPSRNLECLIEAMKFTKSSYTLDLMLVDAGNEAYYNHLRKLAGSNPRIKFRNPLPMKDLIPELNTYHAGICFFQPRTFNLKHALPNKFFEFVQSRVAQIISPSIEMQKITQKYDLGIVVDDFSLQALVNAIHRLEHHNIHRYKENAHKSAPILCAEKELWKIRNRIQTLLGGS